MSNSITNTGQIQTQVDNLSVNKNSFLKKNVITLALLVISVSALAFGIIFGSIPLLLGLSGAALIGAIISEILNCRKSNDSSNSLPSENKPLSEPTPRDQIKLDIPPPSAQFLQDAENMRRENRLLDQRISDF